MTKPLLLVALLTTAACAHGGHQAHHAGGHHHRFTDPAAMAARWDDPARDAWQRPDTLVAALDIAPGMTVTDLGTGTGNPPCLSSRPNYSMLRPRLRA